MEEVTATEARRAALAAQGFSRRRPARPGPAHVRRVVERLGVVQIDSVNVLCRSHYLPFFSRLGPYPVAAVDAAAHRRPRALVEYWAHEASYVSPATHRLLRWRMARADQDAWGSVRSVAVEQPRLLEEVVAHVAARGPCTARELEAALAPGAGRPGEHWGWNWSAVKRACEHLFFAGRLTSAGRTAQFERRYDLPERVLPPQVLAAPDPDPAEAVRELVRTAARATGVATEPTLRDYFRLRPEQSRRAVAELVEAGELVPVRVRGWASAQRRPAYRWHAAVAPRVAARALLTPFDPLVWHRERTEELLGARVRLEFYVPAHLRVHGYYVTPFLLGERVAARVDLKNDRAAPGGPVLRVLAAWAEPPAPPGRGARPAAPAPGEVAAALAAELADLAGWLGCVRTEVAGRGDLAVPLAAEVAARDVAG
ncbi:winged helix-turn-helix domain-containing protein [Kineococcus terrestris]|uniref:winged helix-turn-helix domain-containing protein n=1 Tax=Kineococcus terrestris TaxID=2044856 RepID=UPI0034DABC9C